MSEILAGIKVHLCSRFPNVLLQSRFWSCMHGRCLLWGQSTRSEAGRSKFSVGLPSCGLLPTSPSPLSRSSWPLPLSSPSYTGDISTTSQTEQNDTFLLTATRNITSWQQTWSSPPSPSSTSSEPPSPSFLLHSWTPSSSSSGCNNPIWGSIAILSSQCQKDQGLPKCRGAGGV